MAEPRKSSEVEPKPPRETPAPDNDEQTSGWRGTLARVFGQVKRHLTPAIVAFVGTATGALVTFWLTHDRQPPLPPPPRILICAVVYNPPGYDEPNDESIKLCNSTRDTVDISGWKLTDSNGEYEISQGTILLRGEQWEIKGSTYNPDARSDGVWLHNSHEFVKLYDKKGELVDTYDW